MNGRYKEYKLDNGLVVALQNTPTKTIAAKLRVNYGTVHEKKGEDGLAHFIEHCLVTGGSEKYNPKKADEIRTSFGYSNATTSIGRTFFLGEMLSEDIEKWLRYISESVLKPGFNEQRVEGERKRILGEISEEKSHPMYPIQLEHSKLFYRDHPRGRFVLGSEEVVRNASLDQLRNFHARGYNPTNMELILAGELPDNTEEFVKRYFGSFAPGEDTRIKFPKLSPLEIKTVMHRSAPERLNIGNREESSAQIFITYSGPENGHEDEYAVMVMNHILGGDTDSRLFKKVGLKLGSYSTSVSMNGEYNTGMLQILSNVPAIRINEAVEGIFQETERMKKLRLSKKLIEKIRKLAKFGVAKTFESNDGHIHAIEAKLDKGLTPESFIKGFDEVTAEKVVEVANRYLPDREEGKYILFVRDPLKL